MRALSMALLLMVAGCGYQPPPGVSASDVTECETKATLAMTTAFIPYVGSLGPTWGGVADYCLADKDSDNKKAAEDWLRKTTGKD